MEEPIIDRCHIPMHTGKIQQLEMMFERPERSLEELRAELFRHGGRIEELVLTQNRVSMVSVRFDAAGAARVRCHASFLTAPEPVITALGRYLVKRSRHEWLVVKAYVRERETGAHGPEPMDRGAGGGAVTTKSTKPAKGARGKVYDLGAIYEAVNARYFDGKVVCGIGWGRRGSSKRGARMRMIRFGSYSRMDNLIRVNPVLDDAGVPAEFLEYIVFHEMLHAALPSVGQGARRAHHHRAYRMLERRFPGYERMQKMAAELVGALRG